MRPDPNDSSFGYFAHDNDYWTERYWREDNDTGYIKQCKTVVVDMWRSKGMGTGRGAVGENGSMPTSTDGARIPAAVNGSVVDYEEYKFAQYALQLIDAHDPAVPLFINWDFHVAHEPVCDQIDSAKVSDCSLSLLLSYTRTRIVLTRS